MSLRKRPLNPLLDCIASSPMTLFIKSVMKSVKEWTASLATRFTASSGGLFIVVLSWSVIAGATGLPGSSVGNESGVSIEALGQSCYAISDAQDVLPCSSGYIAQERRAGFSAQVFLGNNVGYLSNVTELLNGTANSQAVHDLFSHHETAELTSALNAGYLANQYGIEITPLRITYVTLFQNRSLPQVQLFAALEESARAQYGTYLGEDIYWGAQLRYLHRRFIANDFFLTDILTEAGAEILTPHEQNSIFLEPSLLYAPQNDWHPSVSFSVMNTGLTDRGISGLALLPQYHFDVGVAPRCSWGDLGLGLDFLLDSNSENSLSAVTLGASYRFGILKLMGSVARNATGFGFIVADDIWSVGISYANQILVDTIGDKFNERKIYLMVGVQF